MKYLVIGDTNIDLIVKSKRIPNSDEETSIEELTIDGGGNGANTAFQIALLGDEVSLISVIGTLPLFDIKKRLEEVGVKIIGKVLEDFPGISISIVDKSGERRLLTFTGVNKLLSVEMLNDYKDEILKADWIHLAGVNEEIAHMIASIKENWSWDPGLLSIDQGLNKETLEKAKILFFNEIEYAKVPKNIKKELNLVVLKKGKNGAEIRVKDVKMYESKGIVVSSIDSTGAGDIFDAVFLHAYLTRGFSLNTALMSANIAGALSTTKIGAQNGAVDWCTIESEVFRYEGST